MQDKRLMTVYTDILQKFMLHHIKLACYLLRVITHGLEKKWLLHMYL